MARNNARSQLEDADWKKSQLEGERLQLQEEIEVMRATVEDLKLACQHHLEDKRDLKASLSEAQKKLNEATDKLSEKDRCMNEERASFNKQVRSLFSVFKVTKIYCRSKNCAGQLFFSLSKIIIIIMPLIIARVCILWLVFMVPTTQMYKKQIIKVGKLFMY